MLSVPRPPVNRRVRPRRPLPALGQHLVRIAWFRFVNLPPGERPADPAMLLTVPEARELERLRRGQSQKG
jgi:hypothetical protein